MPILRKITLGPTTVSRLEKAAEARYQEAGDLAETGHHLASIYLAGYAAEMTIGAAFFEVVMGYGRNRPIDRSARNEMLNAARPLSELEDKSHPVDGLARHLIRQKILHRPPGFDEKFATALVSRIEEICQYWAPELRYRPIEATSGQSELVRNATRWILENRPHP